MEDNCCQEGHALRSERQPLRCDGTLSSPAAGAASCCDDGGDSSLERGAEVRREKVPQRRLLASAHCRPPRNEQERGNTQEPFPPGGPMIIPQCEAGIGGGRRTGTPPRALRARLLTIPLEQTEAETEVRGPSGAAARHQARLSYWLAAMQSYGREAPVQSPRRPRESRECPATVGARREKLTGVSHLRLSWPHGPSMPSRRRLPQSLSHRGLRRKRRHD